MYIMRQACEQIAATGNVNLNVRPTNMFILDNFEIRLMKIDKERKSYYRAPEVKHNDNLITRKSQVFALGRILSTMLLDFKAKPVEPENE